ncbi:MAG: phage integrase N-terminal SAM-like domain-containing protein [Candidatus Dormibacteraeota bacterium]|nr:phage integrase N-terminal SAM-like domain-containing protein [Candidatus Dormibacteraeota bacterium]
MTWRTRRTRRHQLVTVGDPEGLPLTVSEFLEYLRTRNYSERTVGNREHHLAGMVEWLSERGIERPQEVTRPVLERYQRWLFHYRKQKRAADVLHGPARPPDLDSGPLPLAHPPDPDPLQPGLGAGAAAPGAPAAAARAHGPGKPS